MRWALMVAVILFLSGCEQKDEINELKAQIANLQFDLDNLKESQRATFQEEKKKDDTSKLQREIENLNSEIFNIKTSMANLRKNIEELNASIIKIPSSPINCKGHFKPTVFVTKRRANIYNSEGKVVAVWDDCTTFTSFIEKNGKLRITGYFVKGKFRSALDKDWWIDVKDAAKKFKDKNESKNMRAH